MNTIATPNSHALPQRVATPIDASLQQELLAIMCQAADAAAVATLPNFRQVLEIDNKSASHQLDPVTIADREAEKAIRDVLLTRYPQHGFLGEETAPIDHPDALWWVVDPIDGTGAYITGSMQWGTLIGLYDGADVPLGLFDQPYLGERLVGTTDRTELITQDGVRPLATRSTATLQSAVMQTTSPDMFATPFDVSAFDALKSRTAMCRYGGDCYAYVLLAMGFVDLVFETSLKPYDIQALIPIVRGAGGCITTWQGGNPAAGGDVVASAHPDLHAEVLDLLRRIDQ